MSTQLSFSPPDLPRHEEGAVWFYSRGQEVYGPVTFERLVALQSEGELSDEELVWQPHYPDWRPVAGVAGLSRKPKAWPTFARKSLPLSAAEKFPLLVLFGFTLFVVLHFALQDRRLSAQMLADRDPARPAVDDSYEIEVCHDAQTDKAFLAVSYFDAAREDWLTRGWYPTTKGECQVLLRGVRGPVFVFAESRDGTQTWRDGSGLRKFCVHPRDAFLQPQKECVELGSAVLWHDFMPLDLPDGGGRITWRLGDAE